MFLPPMVFGRVGFFSQQENTLAVKELNVKPRGHFWRNLFGKRVSIDFLARCDMMKAAL